MLARLFLLAACVVGGAALTTPANAQVRPGSYEIRLEILDATGPGVTPEVVRQMKSGSIKPSRLCFTPRDLVTVENLPKLDWFSKCAKDVIETRKREKDGPEAAECLSSGVSSGGKVDVTTACPSNVTMKARGTYTPTTLAIVFAITNETGTLTLKATGTRVGDCVETPSDDDADAGDEDDAP